MALQIPDKSLIKNILTDWALSPSRRGYVAPTVFLLSGKKLPRLNYYNSLSAAFSKLKNLSNAGGKNETAAGSVELKQDGTAQTIGINCDYYVPFTKDNVASVPYSVIKSLLQKGFSYFIFRFYKSNGAGPYYGIFNNNLGISATVVKSYSAEKIAALDELYRQKELLKNKYNSLVSFINQLGKEKKTQTEQNVYDEAVQIQMRMLVDMKSIKSLELNFDNTGAIGFLPALSLLAWIAIGAGVAAWAVSKIVEEIQKTKRVHEGYDFQKWATQKIIDIQNDPNLTEAQKKESIAIIKGEIETSKKSVEQSSNNSEGMMGMLKIGIIALVVIKGMDLIKNR